MLVLLLYIADRPYLCTHVCLCVAGNEKTFVFVQHIHIANMQSGS